MKNYNEYIWEVWAKIPREQENEPRYRLPIGPSFVAACAEVDRLRIQLENQSAIIRDMATPVSEREARMLEEISGLRVALAESWDAITHWKECADAAWNVIANVGMADWSRESEEWKNAADRFRSDTYEKCVREYYTRPTGIIYDIPPGR